MSLQGTQPKQRVIYVRVTKMYLPRSNPNVARNLFQQIQPGYSGVISPLMPIQMLDMYSSSAILAFRFHDQNKSNITFIVTELTQTGESEVCRLCLPISWFPHGYVVHHYFPFITKTPQNGTPFIELDVHVDDIQTTPFSAYYGTLKVIPTWIPPPQMTVGATVLIPAPVSIQDKPIQQPQAQPPIKSNQPNIKDKESAKNENQLFKDNGDHHHHHTHIADENSDESEIMLDDLDDVITEESAGQKPPPVLTSNTNDKQQNLQQEVHQPQQSQPKQQPVQQQQQFQQQPQLFQQPQQYQQQHPQQQQQQQQYPQQQQKQQMQYPPFPNTQSNKVQYPPFPPLPNQNSSPHQEDQKPQQHEQAQNTVNQDQQKLTDEKKKFVAPV